MGCPPQIHDFTFPLQCWKCCGILRQTHHSADPLRCIVHSALRLTINGSQIHVHHCGNPHLQSLLPVQSAMPFHNNLQCQKVAVVPQMPCSEWLCGMPSSVAPWMPCSEWLCGMPSPVVPWMPFSVALWDAPPLNWPPNCDYKWHRQVLFNPFATRCVALSTGVWALTVPCGLQL